MHDNWQAMLSFYVAGSLPPDEARAVEAHLATCVSCRQALAEWQAISTAVRAEASDWSRQLPPLSAEVRAAVARRRPNALPLTPAPLPDMPRRVERPPRVHRRAWAPLTALAAALFVVVFGGALLLLSSQDDPDPTEVAMLSIITVTADADEATTTGTPVAAPTRAPSQTDLGILERPTQAPTPTNDVTPFPLDTPVFLPPTVTPPAYSSPFPTTTGGIGGSNLTTLSDICTVTPLNGGSVTLYNYPDTTSEVVGTITADQDLRTYVRSENGWYQIVQIGPGILGWAPGSALALSGPCAALPLPTATIADGACLALIGSDRVDVRTGPGSAYTSIDMLALGERVPVIAQSNNGWYRIRHEVTPSVIIGWIQPPTLNLTGDCNSLPIVNAATYDPGVPTTPVATATFTATPQRGQITEFYTSSTSVARGGSVTLTWNTNNTSRIWLDYYGLDRNSNQASPAPIESRPLTSTSGAWTVTIPADFAYSAARFVIILDNYDNGQGFPRAEIVVAVTD